MRSKLFAPLCALMLVAGLAGSVAFANEALMTPANLNEQAPDNYRVHMETSKGDVVIDITRSWAPKGADRFYNLVKGGYFDDIRFFRVVPNFIVQWGLHADPKVSQAWRQARITDDPVRQSNDRGSIVFATAGPNTRTTQLFINLKNNPGLDGQGFAPFGTVVEGMEAVDQLFSGYSSRTPDQGRLTREGNAYLKASYPRLDFIKTATIASAEEPAEATEAAEAAVPAAPGDLDRVDEK